MGWETCTSTLLDPDTVSYTIKGLKPSEAGSEEKFRIISVNSYGKGRSSNSVGPVKCQDHLVFPGIETLTFKEVLEDQELQIFAKVSGYPKPQIHWEMNDEPLQATERILIETKDESTCLTIEKAVRADMNSYKIIAENSAGTA